MGGILLWLLGVPLSVIVLLYLDLLIPRISANACWPNYACPDMPVLLLDRLVDSRGRNLVLRFLPTIGEPRIAKSGADSQDAPVLMRLHERELA